MNRKPDDGTDIALYPIGTIHTPFAEAVGTPIQGALSGQARGEVVVNSALGEGLADLDGFSHIILIYLFDRITKARLKVKPYLDTEHRGIFATRSPSRPNPIGITVVRLIEIDGLILRVSGVDMLDGTPLLDIKPSIPQFDDHQHRRCGWFEPHLEALRDGQTVPVADDRFHRKNNK